MENWSAPTLPERMLRLKFPTFTGRPRAELRFDSIWGRKLLTLTRNGTAMMTTINRARTMPATFIAGFTAIPPTAGGGRGGLGSVVRFLKQARKFRPGWWGRTRGGHPGARLPHDGARDPPSQRA